MSSIIFGLMLAVSNFANQAPAVNTLSCCGANCCKACACAANCACCKGSECNCAKCTACGCCGKQ